jgi:hypothetical protein
MKKTFYVLLLAFVLGFNFDLFSDCGPCDPDYNMFNFEGAGWVTEIYPALYKNMTIPALSNYRLYARTDVGGIYVSYDNGDSWYNILMHYLPNYEMSPSEMCVQGLAVHPENPDKIVAACGNEILDGALYGFKNICYSDNAGRNWTLSTMNSTGILFKGNNNVSTGYEKLGGGCIVFSPNINGNGKYPMYAGGAPVPTSYSTLNPSHLYTSLDEGHSWSIVESYPTPANDMEHPYTITSIAMKEGSNHIWVGTTDGIFVSTDNGTSWSTVLNTYTHMNVKRIILGSYNGNIIGFCTFGNGGAVGIGKIKKNANGQYDFYGNDLTYNFDIGIGSNQKSTQFSTLLFARDANGIDENHLIAGRYGRPIRESFGSNNGNTEPGSTWSGWDNEFGTGSEQISFLYQPDYYNYPGHQLPSENIIFTGLNNLTPNPQPQYYQCYYSSGGAGCYKSENVNISRIDNSSFSNSRWSYKINGISMPVVNDINFLRTKSDANRKMIACPIMDWVMGWSYGYGHTIHVRLTYDRRQIYNQFGNFYVTDASRCFDNPGILYNGLSYVIGGYQFNDPDHNILRAALYERSQYNDGTYQFTQHFANDPNYTIYPILTTDDRFISDGIMFVTATNSPDAGANRMILLVGQSDGKVPPVGNSLGVFYTDNAGQNWVKPCTFTGASLQDGPSTFARYSQSLLPAAFENSQLGFRTSSQFNLVSAGGGKVFIYLENGGVFKSLDDGANFVHVGAPSVSTPHNNFYLDEGTLKYANGKLFLAIKGNALPHELQPPVPPPGSGTYYPRPGGLFYSVDDGQNWSQVTGDWSNTTYNADATQLEVDATGNYIAVYGKKGGDTYRKLYVSSNAGTSWTDLSTVFNFPIPNVRSLRTRPSPNDNELWIATSGQGAIVYKRFGNITSPLIVQNNMTINSDYFCYRNIEIQSGGSLIINGTNDANGNIPIYMAPGKQIYVQEGGKLIVNDVTFNCTDSTQQWAGIYFENSADSCSIQNSTFNNVTLPIKIVNDDDSYIENGKVIANNIFNTQNNNIDYVIYAENSYNMKIENNQFNMMTEGSTTTGIYTKNHDNGGQGDGDGGGMSGGRKNSDVSKYSFLSKNPVLPEQIFGGAENQKGNSITEDPTPPPIFIKILNNTFNDGNVLMILTSYISERTPYYICGNIATGNSEHILIGRMLTGRIRNNNFSETASTNPIYLEQSNPDMFQNSITGSGTSIVLNGHSFINLAPIDNGTATLSWSGGKNNLYSSEAYNIVIADAGFAYINYGFNTFEKNPDMNYFHISGILDSTVNVYYARNNEWYPGGPHNFLYSSSIPYIITDSYSFYNVMPDYNGYTIVNKGQDIYDTIFTSPNNCNDTVPQDETLFYLANEDRYSDKFFKAVCDYKFLIDNYPSSIYVAGGYSLYNLYDIYELLDTSLNGTNHDKLYSDLINYLDAKIQSGNYDEDFIDVAYYLENMCAANIGYYYEALTGFQFVAMFHPDAEMRLLASWDAAEMEELMNQSGGVSNAQLEEQGQEQLQKSGQEQEKVQKEFRNKLLTKLDIACQRQGKDSVMKIMKKIYDAKNKEIEGNSDSFESTSKDAQKSIKNESNIKNLKTSNNNQKVVKSQNENNSTLRQNDRLKKSFIDINQRKELISRAERNLRTSRSLSAEERQKRQKEDMLYIAGLHSKINKVDNSVSNLPSTYKLYQNYPNPFNPVTKIKYDLPMDSKVTLVVYDILGRQMTKLVSDEFKKSGTYTVEFNGQAFASGVYFYQIQTGNYVQTKKMVLVK